MTDELNAALVNQDKEKLKVEVIQAIAVLTSMGLTFDQAKEKFLEDLKKALPVEPSQKEDL